MIVSKKNEKVKFIRSLFEKKYREEFCLYIAEGIKLVREAIKYNQPIKYIVGVPDLLNSLNVPNGVEVIEVNKEVYDYISNEVSPQGVLCVIQIMQNSNIKIEGDSILLDRVRDAGNVGTIIRTAVASGITNILMYDSADPYSPKAVRASMSGIYLANIVIADIETLLKSINAPLLIADMQGENVFEYNTPKNFCLVIGNEANGVSEYLKNLADVKIRIPMQNEIESLNAGVSSAILTYTLLNRRR